MQINRLPQLLQMLEKQPDDAFLLYATAFEYESQERPEEALSYYNRLHEAHPEYLPLYYQYGLFLHTQGRSDEALHILQSGISLAQAQKDMKTLRELREAVQMVEEDD